MDSLSRRGIFPAMLDDVDSFGSGALTVPDNFPRLTVFLDCVMIGGLSVLFYVFCFDLELVKLLFRSV